MPSYQKHSNASENTTSSPSALRIRIASATDVGGRTYNEDVTDYCITERTVCCVVADGAGGHGGGDVAAQLAARAALDYLARASEDPEGLTSSGPLKTVVPGATAVPGTTVAPDAMRVPEMGIDVMRAAVSTAHEAVVRAQAGGGRLSAMCTTLTLLQIDRRAKTARWAHAGDTRLYLIREGRFYRQTTDHSLMASMIEAGLITAEDAATHPKRHMLLTALGVADEPDIAIGGSDGELMAGDTFILCTDGMWEHLPPAAMLTRGDFPSPEASLAHLVATVQHHAPTSADNCSAIVVWLDE